MKVSRERVMGQVIPNYNIYNELNNLLEGRIAIGGSAALVLQGQLPSSYKIGDLDLCIEDESKLDFIDQYMTRRGWNISIDIPQSNAFTVRRQYKLGEHKHIKVDFFLTPDLDKWALEVAKMKAIKPEVIWAARGYYAGVGSEKAQQQLVKNGMIRPFTPNSTPASKLTRKQVVRRIIGDVKHLVKSFL